MMDGSMDRTASSPELLQRAFVGASLDTQGPTRVAAPSRAFRTSKRAFDIALALAALPFVALVGLVLLAANPFWNRGPLIFSQTRMGKGCRPFTAHKFRSMTPATDDARGPDDPVETHRITRLGAFLRRTRLDETPQFLNVLRGDMSFIGPRPDSWTHAEHFIAAIPGYRLRHMVRPGITGLAQIARGYAEGTDATVLKTRADLAYIRKAGWAMEWKILLGTVRVVITGSGAR